ncbi:MAG: hypothetical protein AMXMBFR8_01080 [Nevskiales bacterium]
MGSLLLPVIALQIDVARNGSRYRWEGLAGYQGVSRQSRAGRPPQGGDYDHPGAGGAVLRAQRRIRQPPAGRPTA